MKTASAAVKVCLASCLMISLIALGPLLTSAGIGDGPLPTLIPEVKTVHVYTVPGVIKHLGLETEFICTSYATSTIRIGVEIFDRLGGAPLNNVTAGNGAADLAGGETVTIGTGSTAGVHEDRVITLSASVKNGSARIVSTSKKIDCTAFIADQVNSPPTTMMSLKVLSKNKQKGE